MWVCRLRLEHNMQDFSISLVSVIICQSTKRNIQEDLHLRRKSFFGTLVMHLDTTYHHRRVYGSKVIVCMPTTIIKFKRNNLMFETNLCIFWNQLGLCVNHFLEAWLQYLTFTSEESEQSGVLATKLVSGDENSVFKLQAELTRSIELFKVRLPLGVLLYKGSVTAFTAAVVSIVLRNLYFIRRLT
jgi:hypothetical protein